MIQHLFNVECEYNGEWHDSGSGETLEAAVKIANICLKFYNIRTRIVTSNGVEVLIDPDELPN
jgi:hypothetical protein